MSSSASTWALAENPNLRIPLATREFLFRGLMKIDAATYVPLLPGEAPPLLARPGPFKAIVVVEDDVTPEWQATVSDWLVRSGCRFMMAWGRRCSEWDDSVDLANQDCFGLGEIPDDEFVMTTWHDQETLEDTFWFAVHAAMHSTLRLDPTYIIHIAPTAQPQEMLQRFREALDK
jgi:hypothetical protein